MKPIIGITVDTSHDPSNPRTRGLLTLNWNYAEAVADAGGVPVLIPPMADMSVLSKVIHGWLIPGGLDIDAERFGERNHPAVQLQDPARFEGEKRLFDLSDPTLPVLGICYGCQFLNVVTGGSLVQHLPDEVDHDEHTGGTLQTYRLEPSRLARELGAEVVEGKSFHHQAVRRLGRSMKAVASAHDGTIEAIESTERPWTLGVQWHPERTLEDAASRRLFTALVVAARAYAEGREVAPAR